MKLAILSFALFLAGFFNGKAQDNHQDQTTDSLIISALSLVNTDSLSSSILALQNYGSRFLIAPNRKEIATWIMNRFISFGIPEVRLDSFPCYTLVDVPPFCTYDTTTWQYNVEAKINGSVYPTREVLMMAHYDSFVSNADPMLSAPGADDNASAVAALLECARVIMLMEYQPEQTMIFLATAAEELNNSSDSGSEHYAMEAAADGRDLAMVVNNDMIGWNDGSWTISLVSDENSQRITDHAMHVIDTFTTLDRNSTWFCTFCDLKYFLDQGYEGIFFMENAENEWYPYYHTVNDLIDHIDTAYLAEITRANLGSLMFSDLLANDAALINIENVPENNCSGSLSPVITLANYSPDTLYSLNIISRVNEEDSIVIPWTGSLVFRETQQVQLPGIGFQALPENILEIRLDNINGTYDQIPGNNVMNVAFGAAVATPSEVKLKIKLDSNPEQTTWDIKDLDGNVIFNGGPYATPNSMVEVTMVFDEPGCYSATVYDEAGNGLQQGFFILYYGSNNIIASIIEFENLEQAQFDVGGTMLADEISPDGTINFYPNPVHNECYMAISLDKPTSMEAGIFNLLGVKVIDIPPQYYEAGRHTLRFHTGNLEQGLYIISVLAGESVIAGKIIKQ